MRIAYVVRYSLLTLIYIFALFTKVLSSVHFYIQEGSEKCFIQDVPRNIPIYVKYENSNDLGIQCAIIFKNPEKIEVFSKHVDEKDSKGSVAYLSKVQGEHSVCIRCESSNWFKSEQLKWKLSIDTGNLSEHLDINSIASREEAIKVDQFIKSLNEKVNGIISEAEYEFEKQEKFLHQALRINHRIIIFSIIQLLLASAITYFSIIYMKIFLEKQRVI
ncbi:hypothetical protein FG386_003618 [Cryptosporidium ryanae]|uniref:uncharacterized protein n=1 Tax=Cryptosporidium ryanae TaxID=515981 RepID=UPI00351A69E9|nr:hypothetical protein FG386_003618 [Cryptosporidium ryanae]